MPKLIINPNQIINESGHGDASLLLKEGKYWFPGWDNFPASAYIALGEEYIIDTLSFEDQEGEGDFIFEVGKPGEWAQIWGGTTDKRGTQTKKTLTITRYVRITLLEAGANIGGLEIFGDVVTTEAAKNFILDISKDGKVLQSIPVSDSLNIGMSFRETDDNPPPPPSQKKRVLHISVDGLRPDILNDNIDDLPAFRQLMLKGNYTLDARTDPDYTTTNQNHVSMWTSMLVVDHGQVGNSNDPDPIPSSIKTIFDQVSDTAAFVGKDKLAKLLANKPIGILESGSDNDITESFKALKEFPAYTFFHFSETDHAGHKSGWESIQYREALKEIDENLGELLTAMPQDTYVILTSDHGGSGTNHDDDNNPLHYTIPIFIHHISMKASIDLEDANPNRIFRNGDTGNLALQLLGLSPIPESSLNVGQDIVLKYEDDVIIPPVDIDKRTLDEFIVTNVLGDDPVDLVKPVSGGPRIYMYLKWANDDVFNTDASKPLSEVKFSFNPASAFSFDIDESFRRFGELGDSTHVTLFESSMWLVGNDKTKLNSIPYKRSEGRDGLDAPERWKYIGHMYYQFAARYGKTKVPINTLKTTSEPLTGLGYLNYLEGENEGERWWNGYDKGDMSPEEYAAYMSMMYDGHMGTVKEGDLKFGAKTADPAMKIVLGGLAYVDFKELLETGRSDWFDRFFGWMEKNRNKAGYDTYCVDVINWHDYPNKGRKQRNLSEYGISPEAYQWFEKNQALISYIKERVPSKEFEYWNTEFGYDVVQSSPQRATPYGPFDSEQVAGMWTIRILLEGWAAGLNLGAQFYFRSDGEGGGGIFQSSGLTVKSSNYRKRQMYYYFAQTRDAFKGFKFVSREVIGDMILVNAVHRDTGKKGYVLWHFTEQNKQSQYSLNVSSNSVMEISIKDNSLTGNKMNKSASGGNVKISVSERPVFVIEN